MSETISWQEFEAIVARLQRSFGGDVKVTTNERIFGKLGRKRQVDICIRATVSTEEVLIIVDCKNWSSKPDVNDVAAFAGLMEDVGAHIGIMVSRAGFSETAHSLAKKKNVSLYRYVDTQKHDWLDGIGLRTSALLEIWELTPIAAYFAHADGTKEPIITDEENDFRLSPRQAAVPLGEAIRQMWDVANDPAKRKEGPWTCEVACTTSARPEVVRLGISVNAKLIRGIRSGRLHFEGLVDEPAGQAKVQGWKMVFDGEMKSVGPGDILPKSRTLTIQAKSTFVRTSNAASETFQKLIYTGILELTVTGKKVGLLPVDPN
ncbi:MAG TPA: restriction endonuclease [Chthoniobacterales bacterium]|nr:restriction endonuclease [Chthoniobacterales bacterium]